MLISVTLFRKQMKSAFAKQREEVGELNASLEDSLLGIRVIKSFATEDFENIEKIRGRKKIYKKRDTGDVSKRYQSFLGLSRNRGGC